MTGQRESKWRELLEAVLPALAELPGEFSWTWGGGTALAQRFHHRISYDIDIFFENAAVLQKLSPNRNPKIKAITDNWQEPEHYIKIERPEGEIDFIIAMMRTVPGALPVEVSGHKILMEAAAEILAKKIHYRGSRAVARDVFDAMAVFHLDPKALEQAVKATPDGARNFADNIRALAPRLKREIPMAVDVTDQGAKLLDQDFLELAAALEGLL
ncbi:nucleotidyl transferase AbiEii/AbiGii toxin family protein [Aestuariispira insulae]|uniref:Nucleotidyltransferase AbiEii toxin of type IV toxin-antitoxin system n=1 Tax=Aestuariispira insulae TaxID=1461337 RepID=A0A3D9HQ37_9PROT|nr:nucleotidyl transferase AbiEii/AbiGii toxin family protein [Aestuariispira insulae]RED51623.1 nucleotidyltransferase AbiEii toxin of type IV toxin-antitoxin system [Aestuariispira insulae]